MVSNLKVEVLLSFLVNPLCHHIQSPYCSLYIHLECHYNSHQMPLRSSCQVLSHPEPAQHIALVIHLQMYGGTYMVHFFLSQLQK